MVNIFGLSISIENITTGAVFCLIGIIAAIIIYLKSKKQTREILARLKRIEEAQGISIEAADLPTAPKPVRTPFAKGLEAMEDYRWSEAIDHFIEALEHADDRQRAALYNLIGLCHYTPGRLDDALASFKEVLDIAKKIDYPEAIAAALGNIGLIYQTRGESLLRSGSPATAKDELDEALEYFEKSLKISEEIGAKETSANQLGNIGNVYVLKGDKQKALEYLNQALALFK